MSVNISKQKRDVLISKVKKLKDFIATCPQDQNTQNLLGYIGDILKEVNRKKYGLVFEEHQEGIDILLENDMPILTEEKDLSIKNGGEQNFLIEGDNLAALQLLEKTHKGKIDVIYIDPPYNTGNKDFIYDDSFVDSTDEFKHSKWLSFMNKRLKIAKSLLKASGVIFISIDDNEQSDLKILCDEIFCEDNFIATVPRVTKKSGKDHADGVAKNNDYVHIYTKNKEFALFKGITAIDADYPLQDEFFETRGGYKLNQTLDYDSLWYNPAMDFPISIDGINYYPGGTKELHTARHNGNHKAKDWVWRWSLEKFKFGLENGFVVIKKGRGRPRIYTKTYANASISNSRPYIIEYQSRETKLSSVALIENKFSNDNAKKEITRVGLDEFGFPKPVSLISQLLKICQNQETILDFFAGSGTTGHAVLKLNAEDGGHRKFILCTNNENNICRDITYQRLKTVITGKRKDGSTYSDGLPGSLKYLKVGFIPVNDQMYYEYADQLLENIRTLVELENTVDMNNSKTVSIILDDDELEKFIDSIDQHLECKSLYLSHDVLISSEQEQKLHKNGIEIKTVPEYYYPDTESRGSDEH